MLTANKFMRPVGIGITSPVLIRDTNGEIFVVKLMQNPLGSKILVNELLAVQIGQKLKLSFPPAGIMKIEKGRFKGLHFASQFLHNTVYLSPQNIKKVSNISDLAGIILFDHLFFNIDRSHNRKNLLAVKDNKNYYMYAIDNSHLFKHAKWTVAYLNKLADEISINTHKMFGVILKKYLQPECFTPFITRIKTMDYDEIEKIISALPEEWLADINERKALAEFVAVRLSMAEKVSDRLCLLIPDKHRRSDID